MKFGKTYGNHQIPEWSEHYVDYKELKQIVRQIATRQQELLTAKRNEDVEVGSSGTPKYGLNSTIGIDEIIGTLQNPQIKKLLSQFLIEFEKNLDNAEEFFSKQFNEYDRRLRRLLNDPVVIEEQSARDMDSIDTSRGIFNPNGNANDTGNGVQNKEDFDDYVSILIELRSNLRKLKWYGDLNKRACIKILKKLDKKCGTDQQQRFLNERVYSLDFTSCDEIDNDLDSIHQLLDLFSCDVKNTPENDATHSSNGLNHASCIENNSPDVLTQLIENDDGQGLVNELIYMHRSVVLIPTRLLISLLNKSALLQSFHCIDEILEIIPSLEDHTDINKRNFFHHHVISLGKNVRKLKTGGSANAGSEKLSGTKIDERYLSPAVEPEKLLTGSIGSDGINSFDSPNSLKYILEKLPLHLRASIVRKDIYKRTPLHYAAQYGLVEISKIIIKNLKNWDVWISNTPIDDPASWADSENLTPLHLAVMGNHPLTVETLMSFVNPDVKTNSPKLLFLATKLNSCKLIESLLSINGFNVNYMESGKNGETALHVATRLNLLSAAECLIKNGANTEIKENNYGWSPIFLAASDGFKEMCELLINEGHCNILVFDDSGWTPMEHAALKGHLDVARLLGIVDPDICNPVMSMEENERSKSPFGNQSTNKNFYKNSSSSLHINDLAKKTSSSNLSLEKLSKELKNSRKPSKKNNLMEESIEEQINSLDASSVSSKAVKTFGNDYLKPNESFISVTLGSNDTSSLSPAITLNKIPFTKASSTELDTALSLMITCQDSIDNETCILDLPLDETVNAVNFKVPFREDGKHVIFFDLVPTYGFNSVKTKRQHSNESDTSPTRHRGGRHRSVKPLEQHHQYSNRSMRANDSHSPTPSMSGFGAGYTQYASNNGPAKTAKSSILGRAIALLDSAMTRVGDKRRSLQDTITVPLLSSENMEILGTVNFEFILVNPFQPNHGVSTDNIKKWFNSDTYWKQLVSTRVIGHRGLGKNMDSKKTLQLGENTVESFIAAASLGASYVEFDVQLTKDDVPVIYHDFLVAESGVDIPMHELTLEQFLDLNNIDEEEEGEEENKDLSHQPDSKHDGTGPLNHRGEVGETQVRRRRRSVDDHDLTNKTAKLNKKTLEKFWERRMRYTKTYKEKNFKGNFRGSSIASSFVTLKEVFQKLPPQVGFNIECKYPMRDEAKKEDMTQIVIEMNHWLDTVLQTVYDNCSDRDIIFSSFHPDICIMLSLKQPNFPVLYLTEAGSQIMADSRAVSLQNAVRFSRTWNLLGIVSAAAPIVLAPRLAHIVKSSGLVLFTYGSENNDPENAKREIQAGVDAVIVDSVLAVRKGLTKSSSSSSNQINSIPSFY